MTLHTLKAGEETKIKVDLAKVRDRRTRRNRCSEDVHDYIRIAGYSDVAKRFSFVLSDSILFNFISILVPVWKCDHVAVACHGT